MLWENAASELDRYLSQSARITPGTAPPFCCPTEQLPYLDKGVPLYDATLAWINHVWGGYDRMPQPGRRRWFLVLRLSRGGDAPAASLRSWAQWLAANDSDEPLPTVKGTRSTPAPGTGGANEPLTDGTVKSGRIWLKGKLYPLTPGLRELLKYLLTNPNVSEEQVIRDLGLSGSSHLHKRLKDLRNKLANELKKSGWRLQIKTLERLISCKWEKAK